MSPEHEAPAEARTDVNAKPSAGPPASIDVPSSQHKLENSQFGAAGKYFAAPFVKSLFAKLNMGVHGHLSRAGAASAQNFARSVRTFPQASCQRRNLQDVAITRTGKPILRTAGGRSSLGGHTVTVFGATGFLGRYIVNRLARSGNTVVIPFREEMAKRHLKVAGDLGRVWFLEHDLRNTQSIEECVRHSDIVINLIGRDYPTKNFSFEDVHVEGTERIAEAVAKYDVDRFIHMSSHSVSKESPSEFLRTKAFSEEVARNIFPETTIVRPAPMFGWEDRLLNKFGGESSVFTSNRLQQKIWPVHAIDVGAALEILALDDSTAGETFELYGPKQYTMQEIHDICAREVLKVRPAVNVPAFIRKPVANILSKTLWWVENNGDMVTREFIDQIIDPKAKTFKDLNIEPMEMQACTYEYLQGFRSNVYYDLPPMTEREKATEKKYLHVIDDQ